MTDHQPSAEPPRNIRAVTSHGPFAAELLQALGHSGVEGVLDLTLRVEPGHLVRVEIVQMLSQDKADALLESLRCRDYALIEILPDEPPAPAAAATEPTAA